MKIIARLLVLAVIAGVVYGALNWERVAPLLGIEVAADTTEIETVALTPAPETLHRLVLLDVTSSTDASFKEHIRATLAAAVADYVPAQPAVTKDGVAALAGLDLIVRLVGTKPLEYGAPHYEVTIPAIAGLPARPDMATEGALNPGGSYQEWKDAEKIWGEQYAAAQAASAAAAAQVQAINVDMDEWSAITAGAVALALLAPADAEVEFLVASDLDDNQPVQQAGSFNGHPILVIQPDPFGDQAYADQLFSTFSAWANAQGAGQIVRVRPEIADGNITTFVKGVRS